MDLVVIAFIVFLCIFTLTAILTLLSLVGMVKIQPQFQKQLFRLVILEVVAVVISFVSNTLMSTSGGHFSEKLLLQAQGWDSKYLEKGWKTQMRFQKKDNKIELIGTTFFVPSGNTGQLIPIIEWHSIEPIRIPQLATQISFRVASKYTQDVMKVSPELQYEIGKERTGVIKLDLDLGMRGSWIPDGTADNWGLMFNRVWQ